MNINQFMDSEGYHFLKPKLEEEDLFIGAMQEYNDSPIPPLTYFSPAPLSYFSPTQGRISIEKESSSVQKRDRTESSDREREQKRRKVMTENYSVLQSIVPDLHKTKNAKTLQRSHENVVCDTIKYITFLEEEVQRLEALKKSRMQKEPKIGKVTISGGATFLSTKRPITHGLVQDIVKVLEKHNAEVLDARVFVDEQRFLTFTATIMIGNGGASSVDKIKGEISGL